MACDVLAMTGMDGEIGDLQMALPVEGELGSHMVQACGVMMEQTELLAQLFEFAAALPHLMHNAKLPESKAFVHITSEQVELAHEIHEMMQELETGDSKNEGRPKEMAKLAQKPEIHRSLFSLAGAMNSAQVKQQRAEQQPLNTAQQHSFAQPHTSISSPRSAQKSPSHLRVEEREGGGNGKQGRDDQQQQKRKDQGYIRKVSSKRTSVTVGSSSSSSVSEPILGSIDNIYVKFMALMARILGQAEAEAHQLYVKIKDRTDKIDTLSLLMAKINNSPKDIDWSKDEQMQELVKRAREIGVDIPEGKYKWEESEKHLLKENIQMRKDSMEKITQLERTDMQRYLQEASQCHQARSNVLKLLKEVIDTIIHNMRP